MGNVIGRSNRVRRLKVVVESLLVLCLLRKWKLSTPEWRLPLSRAPSRRSPAIPQEQIDIEEEQQSDEVLTPSLLMTVVRLGRRIRQMLDRVTGGIVDPVWTWLRRLLLNTHPYKLVIGVWLVSHVLSNLSLLMGLNAPYSSLITQPDMHYSPTFSRVRWFLTCMDAAVLSARRVWFMPLRIVLTLFLVVYYLIWSRHGEAKVWEFRKSVTVDDVRACWEKGQMPVIRLVDGIGRPVLKVHAHEIQVFRPKNKFFSDPHSGEIGSQDLAMSRAGNVHSHTSDPRSTGKPSTKSGVISEGGVVSVSDTRPSHVRALFPEVERAVRQEVQQGRHLRISSYRSPDAPAVKCYWYYEPKRPKKSPSLDKQAALKMLTDEHRMIFHVPGGGFVAQDHQHHECYSVEWAHKLHVPLLSILYRKAPQHPYPCGFNDIFDVFCQICATQGRAVGMNKAGKPLQIVIVGDSAGGNLATGLVNRVIVEAPWFVPNIIGLHLVYPCLDLGCKLWSDFSETSEDLAAHTRLGEGSNLPSQIHETKVARPPVLSSRGMYANDGVLPMQYLLLLGRAYLRYAGAPDTDFYISQVHTPRAVLKNFPSIYIHVGGVDPLRDDSVRLVNALNRSWGYTQTRGSEDPSGRTLAEHETESHITGVDKRRRRYGKVIKLQVIPGVSHAYFHVTTFLPEGKQAVETSIEWFSEMFALARKRVQHNMTPSGNKAPTLQATL